MYKQIQKEKYSQRQQKVAKGIRHIMIFAALTAIVAVVSLGLGL
jgi:hypothetical protein